MAVVRQIVIEVETPGDSRTMFRLRMDANLIAEGLTAVQAHILVGETLDRIAPPRPIETNEKTRKWSSLNRRPPRPATLADAHCRMLYLTCAALPE